MRAIWKKRLQDYPGTFTLNFPGGAKLIHVQEALRVPWVWAEVDEEKGTEARKLLAARPGQPIPDEYAEYLGAFIPWEDPNRALFYYAEQAA